MGRLLSVALCLIIFSREVHRNNAQSSISDLFAQMNAVQIGQYFYNQFPQFLKPALANFMKAVGMVQVDDTIFVTTAQGIKFEFTTTSNCALCKGLATLIKVTEYTILEPAVIALCIAATVPTGTKGDIMCPGLIKLQLPHVARVVKDPLVTTRKFCENFNLCFPSPLTDSIISLPEIGFEKTSTRRGGPIMKVVQLTDIHVERHYAVNSSTDCGLPVCCLEKWGPGNAGPFGDYHCNIPRVTIEMFLEKVKTFSPDIVLFSGDIPPHTVWDETPESQMACSEMLVETLARNLSDYMVYPVIGNHEMFPTNLYSLKNLIYTKPFIDQWRSLWQPLAKFSIDKVEDSGSYSLLLKRGLRLIVFNSNYMYTFNWYNSLNDLPLRETAKMRAFVTDSLNKARANDEKVILLGHHPPGGSDYIVTGSRWLENLILSYKDIIVLMPTGHTHFDEFRMVYDSIGQPQAVIYVAPSMTSVGTINPSMRIYELDASTYEVVDYHDYYLDLNSAIENSTGYPSDWSLEIKLLYSAKAEYGLPDLSPSSWHEFIQRLKSDEELLKKHVQHSHAYAYTDNSAVSCSEDCKKELNCRLLNVNYDKYLECSGGNGLSKFF